MALPLALALGLGAAACTGGSTGATPGATSTTDDLDVAALGAVPIPTPPPTPPVPTASGARLQLLAMGEPVLVVLADGSRATVTANGPRQDHQGVVVPTPGQPPPRTKATMTVSARGETGTTVLSASDLSCRDDSGASIRLTPLGPASRRVAAGSTGQLEVSGVFRSGSAQLTWAPGGHVMAVWDFTIELD
ncbi:hypothetical protein V3N99_02105 [Dermatophilaceae bacterium Soc4.6]